MRENIRQIEAETNKLIGYMREAGFQEIALVDACNRAYQHFKHLDEFALKYYTLEYLKEMFEERLKGGLRQNG